MRAETGEAPATRLFVRRQGCGEGAPTRRILDPLWAHILFPSLVQGRAIWGMGDFATVAVSSRRAAANETALSGIKFTRP